MNENQNSRERKQRVTLLCVSLFVMLTALSAITQAQDLPVGDLRNDEFLRRFVQIKNLNPTVKDFNKMDVGYVYGLPNNDTDHLEVGDTNGIWGREFRKFYGISYSDFLAGKIVPTPTVTPTATPTPIPVLASTEPWWFEKLPWWLWLLLLAIPASVLFGFLLNRLYRQSPIEWRPMVSGGVDDITVLNRFARQGYIRRHGAFIPGTLRKVRLYGVWGTQHYGIPVSVPHRYNGERAYVARFRMKNGVERDGVMLQGCGNDIASGAWYVQYPGARIEEGWGDENSSNQNSSTPAPKMPTRDQQMAIPTTEIVPPKTTSLRSGRDSDLHGEDEPVVVKGPSPAPVAVVKKPTESFISFASSDKNGPSMIRWNGIDVHSMHIGPDGTKTLRFTQNEE